MSNTSVSDLVLEKTQESDKAYIKSIVSSMYIVDYGIVHKVNSDETIDVKHAKKINMKNGAVVEPYTLTPSVEVLFPSSGEFSFKFPLTAGDRVLLVGLKNALRSVDIATPSKQDVYMHYSQETLKAIPFCLPSSSAKIVIEADNGTLVVKNQINSLKTILDDLIDALTTGWVSINCVVGAPVTPNPTTLSALNNVKAKFATLFKE